MHQDGALLRILSKYFEADMAIPKVNF